MSTVLNVMDVSDEDVDKVPDQPVGTPAGEPVEPPATPEQPEAAEPEPEEEEQPGEVPPASEEPPGEEQPAGEVPADQEPAVEPPAAPEAPPAKAPPPTGTPGEPKKTEQKPAEDPTDYKSFYQRIMAPIKGGGKTIQLTSAEEAIALMQKGLDYTRKTQALGKYQKFGMMLENNGLLDEGKLDLLISVHNKDPEAIKRFFRENKIDPVEIDTTTEDKYKGGTHVVSDPTAKLQTAIDDLKAAEGGEETLQVIRAWDTPSRQVFGDHPELLEAIHRQRLDGSYAKVSAEVERRRAIGQIPSGVPFLQAYKQVGDELQAQGKLGGSTNAGPKAPAATGKTAAAPVVRRPASPPPSVTPGKSAARAAAATRTTPQVNRAVPNFMAMSDDEFEKVKL